MKRSLFVAIAGLAASGCYSSNTSYPAYGDVYLYWDFDRHLLDGTTVAYDTNVNPGGGSRACLQSGVDTIDVTYPDGTPVDATSLNIPCVYAGVQGVTIPGLPVGHHTFVVTGYRNLVGPALYSGTIGVDVIGGQAVSPPTVTASGLRGTLVVNGILRNGLTTYATCGDAAVDTIDYWLKDGYGTLLGSGSVPCVTTQAFGVNFGLVDLDVDHVWLDAVRTGTGIIFSVCQQPITHYANDSPSVYVDYGVCTPGP
jgi:hypothetical protein